MDCNKQRPPKWSATKFVESEKDQIKTSWRKLVDGEHLDFGEGTSNKKRMDRLIDELKRSCSEFKRDHRTGMPAGSKKYKWLLQFVTRESKKESGQDQDEDAEQVELESSAMSFRSVQGLHNCDTASGFFRNEDLPPTQHSQIVSFPDTDQKTNDLTHSI